MREESILLGHRILARVVIMLPLLFVPGFQFPFGEKSFLMVSVETAQSLIPRLQTRRLIHWLTFFTLRRLIVLTVWFKTFHLVSVGTL